MFAQTLGTVGAMGIGHFHDDRVDRGNVAHGRDQIIMQVFGAARNVFLHQRHAEPLRDAALHLPFDQQRVDCAPDIMGGGEMQRADEAELQVNRHRHQMRRIAELGIGRALPVGIQRAGQRIVAFGGAQDVAFGIGGQGFQVDPVAAGIVGDKDFAIRKSQFRIRCRIAPPQNILPQRHPGKPRRIAGHKRLPRGRGFAAIRRAVGVGADQLQHLHRHPQRRGKNLRDHGVGALPDVRRPLMQHDATIRPHPGLDGGRVRQRGIAAAIPARRHPDPAFLPIMGGVEGRAVRFRRRPCRAKRLQTGFYPDPLRKDLTADGRLAIVEGVQNPELQRVHPQLFRQRIEQAFLCHGGLRHPKAAKRSGRRAMRVHGARPGQVIGHQIGARGMDRHPRRHRRPPTRIRAGVEIALKMETAQPAILGRADPQMDRRRMALGGRLHGFRARIGHPHWPAGFQRRQRQIGLHRQVQF